MKQSIFQLHHVPTFLLALIGVCFAAGCSSSASALPKLVPVAGKVILDGVPLAGASVIFVPKDKTKGTGGIGVTDADGRYQARHMSNKIGIQPGTYSVVFSKIALPDGSPIPPGKNAADVGAMESIPPQLSNPPPDYVLYAAAVNDTGGTFDFNLASR